jgi:hypothetical protein
VRHHALLKTLSRKALPLKAVLLVLLALQLVLGLQLQAAQAAMAGMPMPTAPMTTAMHVGTTADAEPMPVRATVAEAAAPSAAQPGCPAHSRAHNFPPGASTGTHDSARGALMGAHDCCHAGACQCHCVYTPGAIALPVLANIATSIAISSLASTQFVAPRIDEFLRPPIV